MELTEPTGPSEVVRPPYYYRLFGMPFATPEPVPGVVETAAEAGAVRVRFGDVPDEIDNPAYRDDAVQASASEYLFANPSGVRLYIRGDHEITLEPDRQVERALRWMLIFGIGASVAGLRRGFVPLHASAVEACGGCVALAGQSGFGKSTLAASLVSLGYPLFADDLCLIQPGGAQGPLVGAGLRESRLCDDAVDALDWVDHAPVASHRGPDKHVYRFTHDTPSLLPLKRIYVLDYAREDWPAGIHRLRGIESLQAVIGCLRMRLGMLNVGDRERTFAALAAVCGAAEVYRFVRPCELAALRDWTRHLANHFSA